MAVNSEQQTANGKRSRIRPGGEVTRHLRGLEARGSRGLVAQLIDSLMGESSGQMEAVRKAAANGDREALYRAAHSLQGSVAIVGADSVARACAELVKTARKGSLEHVTPLVAAGRVGHRSHPQSARRLDRKRVGGFRGGVFGRASRLPASGAGACSSSTTTTAFAESRRCSSKAWGTTSRRRATASKGSPSFSSASISFCSTSSCPGSMASMCAGAFVRILRAGTCP